MCANSAERRPRCAARLLAAFAWLSGLGLPVLLGLAISFLIARGGSTLGPSLLFGDVPALAALTGRAPVFDGLWPALAGTLALVVGTCLIALPVGIASGIYLSEFARGRWARLVNLCVDVLAAVPSILMGLLGFGLILLLRRTLLPDAGTCLLLAIACMALLVLPYSIRTTEAALQGLPEPLRLIGPSLGLTPKQNLCRVLLPTSSRGVLGGAVLTIGRAAEDLAVILLTGVVASSGLPAGLTSRFEAIPFRIFYLASEHRTGAELELAFGAAVVLMGLTAFLFGLAHLLHGGLRRRIL
ncbi:MAG: ABC transporter permease subunit [Planctomycetes bacterium]|nr:ABC transporter permease subunit [Planctomycetota bacterium]